MSEFNPHWSCDTAGRHGVVDRLFLRLHDVENTGPFLEPSFPISVSIHSCYIWHMCLCLLVTMEISQNTAIETVKYMYISLKKRLSKTRYFGNRVL